MDSESESELLLVTRQNDNHSPWPGRLVPKLNKHKVHTQDVFKHKKECSEEPEMQKATGALHQSVVVCHSTRGIYHLDYSPMYLDFFVRHVYPNIW